MKVFILNKNLLKLTLVVFIFAVFLLTMASTPVSAKSSHTIKNAWIPYTTTFVVSGNNYSIRSLGVEKEDLSSAFIMVKKNVDVLVTVPFGECVETDSYKYCFENRSFENSFVDIDSRGVVQPALKVNLVEYSYSNKLSLSRTFSTKKVNLDGTIIVTLTLTNDGDFIFNNVHLSETIPEGFELVSNAENIYLQNGLLTTNFNLYPHKTWTSSYEIKPLSYDSKAKYKSTFYYVDSEGNSKSISTSEDELSVQQPYTLSAKLNKKSLDLEEKLVFDLIVKNTDDVDLKVTDLNVVFSIPLKNYDKKYLSFDGQNFISSEDTVQASKSIDYQVSGLVKKTGFSKIDYSGKILIRDLEFPFSGSLNFSSSTKLLNCSIDVVGDLVSQNKISYFVTIDNLDNIIFYNLNGSLKLDGVDDVLVTEPVLSKGFSKRIFGGTYELSFSLDEYNKTIYFNGRYRTEYNEFFDLVCEKNIVIKPLDRMVVVSFDNSSLEINSTHVLNVTLTNVLDKNLKVLVDYGFDFETVLLKPLSSQNVSLELSIPEKYSSSTLKIPLNLTIKKYDYLDSMILQIPISDPFIDSSLNDSSLSTNVDSDVSSDDSVEVTITKRHPTTSTKGKSFWEQIVFLFESIFG